MRPLRLLTVDEVIVLHRQSIDLYGGSHGIRDQGLLESAIMQPGQTFGGIPSQRPGLKLRPRIGMGLL